MLVQSDGEAHRAVYSMEAEMTWYESLFLAYCCGTCAHYWWKQGR